MYHHISEEEGSGLTISAPKLEAQLKLLVNHNYRSWHFSELMNTRELQSRKNVVITFDDAYVSQLEYAVPLLQKYNLKATFFVPLGYLGKTDSWNTGQLDIMTAEQLKSLPDLIELGYHSYYHEKYHEMPLEKIDEDLQMSKKTVNASGLRFREVIAYPYGKYPKEANARLQFQWLLQEFGINYGLRIGNRINRFPFKKPYEIQRLDIKGQYSLIRFQRKLRYGKFL